MTTQAELVTDPCWVCGGTETTRHPGGWTEDLTPEDLRITDKRYGLTLPLRSCDSCGFLFAAADGLPKLTGLYEALDDAEYGSSAAGRRKQMAHLMAWVADGLPAGATVLDVGSASGLLLEAAAALGHVPTGIEPSRPLVTHAREAGLDVIAGVLPHPDLDDRSFDVVTLIDVVEHVDDPVGLLAACRDRVAPGGRVAVVTPDVASVAARLLGDRWWHRRLAHVGYFDRATLTAALDRAGLRPVRWARPRWYFPVGYLVERVLQYVPGLRGRVDGDGGSGFIIPLNLRDSLAVIAEPTS